MKVKPINSADETDEIHSNISNQLLEPTKKRKPYEGLIPLNLFIVSTISLLIISGCLFVWIASFSVTSNSIQKLNAKFIEESGQKIKNSLYGYIDPIAKLTKMMARDWNSQAVNLTQFREYLFPKFVEFGANGCGYFFNDTYSYRYTYTVSGTASNPISVYAQQPYGYVGTIRDLVNNNTGEVIKYNYQVDTKPIIMTTQDFWIYLNNSYTKYGLDGVVGEPYRSIGATMAIYYAKWIYDQQLYKATKTKRIIGLAKVNLALDAIVNFLSQIELLGKGYVLVTLNSGTVIGGSINTTVNDGLTSLNVFDLETRGAGKLIKQFYVENGNTFETFKKTEMTLSSDGASYIVTPMKFSYENLEWNIFFVLYESDVNEPMVLSSSISIGVTVVIVLVGVCSSLITGLIVSKPMKFLEKQFEFIRIMDLEAVSLSNKSIFKEVDSIFGNLYDTVMWLKEIKAFIPEYVFEQIKQNETISIKSETVKKTKENNQPHAKGDDNLSHSSSSLANKSHVPSNSSGNHSSAKSSFKTAQSLFKMGYSKKNCVVVHVKLEGLIEGGHEFISSFFKDFISAIAPVIKVNQANLQVMTCDEFQLSIPSNKIEAKVLEKAIDCGLKIIKASGKNVHPRIGVCYGACHIGNIGTNTARYYSVVGRVPDTAKLYSELAGKYGVKIITDNVNLPLDSFINRPLDRIEVKPDILTIYEVIDKKNTDNDEWLYELENSKKNNKFQDFNEIFELFQPSYWNNFNQDPSQVVDKCRGILEKFKKEEFKESTDLSCDELLALFSHLPNSGNVSELSSKLTGYSKKLYIELK